MNQVVVTGLGAISCNGNSVNEFWQSILGGKENYRRTIPFAENTPFKIYGSIQDQDIFFNNLSGEEILQYDRSVLLALIAAQEAVSGSAINFNNCNKKRVAVIMGTTCGTNLSVEEDDFVMKWYSDQDSIGKKHFIKYNHSDIPNAISRKYQLQGASYLESTACASGNHSIGEGADLIKLGEADIVICGGAEALSLLPLLGFNSMSALSPDKCSPFDKDRKGVVIGEGAGVIILESEKHALQRNAKIYAKFQSWSINCDAENITAPIENGTRIAQLIKACLKDGNIDTNELDYISLHGTGTKKNDIAESNGIKLALKDQWNKTYASSIKSMIGHTFGAAGALNSIVSILAIQEGKVPPQINLICPQDNLGLNLVTKGNKCAQIDNALSLSFGFGGCNVACLFSKYS
jgi:3-oxoacyl-[acyl-carrier-protein] synthase II